MPLFFCSWPKEPKLVLNHCIGASKFTFTADELDRCKKITLASENHFRIQQVTTYYLLKSNIEKIFFQQKVKKTQRFPVYICYFFIKSLLLSASASGMRLCSRRD